MRRLILQKAGKRRAESRGLAACVARRFAVEPSPVSRFKSGKESFPTEKLDELLAFSEHRDAKSPA